MSKLGFSVKIDVTKIDKARLYKGAKGVYLDATCFMDPDNPGQYGDHGMITQDVSKEEREAGTKGAIVGNVKVFWREGGQAQPSTPAPAMPNDFDEDIPFN